MFICFNILNGLLIRDLNFFMVVSDQSPWLAGTAFAPAVRVGVGGGDSCLVPYDVQSPI